MAKYALQRIFLHIPSLIIISFVTFALIRFIPGDTAVAMTEELGYAANLEELRSLLGIDRPIHVQYFDWVGGFFQGDFGHSLWDGSDAGAELLHRLPITLEIALLSLLISVVIAIPVGVYSAVRQDTWGDYTARSAVVLFDSVPHFWIATLILILPAYYVGWVPPVGWVAFSEDPIKHLMLVGLPASILGVGSTASLIRLTRAMMLETLRQDYVRTAWSKGLSENTVLYRHALKNALIPVVTFFGLRIPNAVSGSVIMEAVFGIPGVGRWIIDAINFRDYPQLQVALLFIAIMVMVSNLLVDLFYGWLDPRVHYN